MLNRWSHAVEQNLKNDHPKEYQRMKDAGELQQHLEAEAKRGEEMFEQILSELKLMHPAPKSDDPRTQAQHLKTLSGMAAETVYDNLLIPAPSEIES